MNISMTFIRIKERKVGTTMNVLTMFIQRKEKKKQQQTSWWRSFKEEKKGRNNKECLDNIHSKKERKEGVSANLSSKWQMLEEEDLRRKNHSKEITSEEERTNDNVNHLKKEINDNNKDKQIMTLIVWKIK